MKLAKTFDLQTAQAVRQKYLQLGRELETRACLEDLAHTHSKLGIFLEELFGYDLWRNIDAYLKTENKLRKVRNENK